ncbi:MAG: FHA domain-containing protein [Acidobacteria bacterium]|nr:FHA domain-containing protein [Acidobacteriota bacterium]
MLTFPRLVPLTDIAQEAVNGDPVIIQRFPFKVGRERRSTAVKISNLANRLTGPARGNDLQLIDDGECVNVSSSHFMIEAEGGKYFITDLGSQCGTIVEGKRLGGNRRGGRQELLDQEVIIVGSAKSPFVFKFRTPAA